MKLIITESQLKNIIEQSDAAMDRRGNALLNATGVRSDKDYNTVNKVINNSSPLSLTITPHTAALIFGVAAAFIPVIGPFISAGIGLADAALYYQEGDTKTAGMSAMFSIMPGIGPIVSKIPGIKQLGSKGMSLLATKISKGIKITDPNEIGIINTIAKNLELVKSSVSNHVKSIAQKVSTNPVNNNIKNTLLDLAKNGVIYGGAGTTYSLGYDYKLKKEEEDNIKKLNQMLGIK